MITATKEIADNWIKITAEGAFTCAECGNDGLVKVSTPEGLDDIDVDAVKSELTNFPTKIIYAVCEVCGMEYVLHLVSGDLYLEPSEEEK